MPPTASSLDARKLIGLRAVANDSPVSAPLLRELEELGLVEKKAGTYIATPQGHIHLMFGSAR